MPQAKYTVVAHGLISASSSQLWNHEFCNLLYIGVRIRGTTIYKGQNNLVQQTGHPAAEFRGPG